MSTNAQTLLVCAAPAPDADDYYARLIGSFDTVVAVDAGADVCVRAGRSPDVMIGDFDSLDPGVLSSLIENGIEQIRYPADKDMTDLDLALRLLQDRGVRGVTVTAAWGRRLDHTLAAVGSVSRCPDLQVDLADPSLAGWVLDALHRPEVLLEGLGSHVSLFAIAHAAIVSCEGMRYSLRRDTLAPLSSWGLSNTVSLEHARITVHEGTVLALSEVVDGVASAQVHDSLDDETR